MLKEKDLRFGIRWRYSKRCLHSNLSIHLLSSCNIPGGKEAQSLSTWNANHSFAFGQWGGSSGLGRMG